MLTFMCRPELLSSHLIDISTFGARMKREILREAPEEDVTHQRARESEDVLCF